mmetsp:Transcript_32866/g.69175  ORF Transcript_32866/g.69175 Transcript_32866/m.69175 type:complete len:243 (-) Transcript_32866:183-911(-)
MARSVPSSADPSSSTANASAAPLCPPNGSCVPLSPAAASTVGMPSTSSAAPGGRASPSRAASSISPREMREVAMSITTGGRPSVRGHAKASGLVPKTRDLPPVVVRNGGELQHAIPISPFCAASCSSGAQRDPTMPRHPTTASMQSPSSWAVEASTGSPAANADIARPPCASERRMPGATEVSDGRAEPDTLPLRMEVRIAGSRPNPCATFPSRCALTSASATIAAAPLSSPASCSNKRQRA